MTKIGKGPNSLDELLKRELKTDQPDWATIQPQAAEYARLAADLGKADPAKGSKESWAKQTSAFSDSATALDKCGAGQGPERRPGRPRRNSASRAWSATGNTAAARAAGGFGPPGGRGGPPPGPPPGLNCAGLGGTSRV